MEAQPQSILRRARPPSGVATGPGFSGLSSWFLHNFIPWYCSSLSPCFLPLNFSLYFSWIRLIAFYFLIYLLFILLQIYISKAFNLFSFFLIAHNMLRSIHNILLVFSSICCLGLINNYTKIDYVLNLIFFLGPIRLPIWGSYPLSLMINWHFPHFVFQKWAKKYGQVFGMYIGDFLCVVTNDYDTCKEVFNRVEFDGKPDIVAARTRNIGFQQLGKFYFCYLYF